MNLTNLFGLLVVGILGYAAYRTHQRRQLSLIPIPARDRVVPTSILQRMANAPFSAN